MTDNLIWLSDIAPPTLRLKGEAEIADETMDVLACAACGGRTMFVTVPLEGPPSMHCAWCRTLIGQVGWIGDDDD